MINVYKAQRSNGLRALGSRVPCPRGPVSQDSLILGIPCPSFPGSKGPGVQGSKGLSVQGLRIQGSQGDRVQCNLSLVLGFQASKAPGFKCPRGSKVLVSKGSASKGPMFQYFMCKGDRVQCHLSLVLGSQGPMVPVSMGSQRPHVQVFHVPG